MQTLHLTIVNQLGLHARAAAKLVDLSNRFLCEIQLNVQDKQANCKSILDVLTLGASHGNECVCQIDGPEEENAAEQIKALFESGFGEGVAPSS